MAGPGRRGAAHRVEQEDAADGRRPQPVGRRAEAEAQVVVEADERTHDQKARREQPGQSRVGGDAAQVDEEQARLQRARREVARRRQQAPEGECRQRPEHSEDRQAVAPVQPIGDQGDEEAAGHAAQRVGGDVDAHRPTAGAGDDLLAQVGHGGRRHAGDAGAQASPAKQQQQEIRRQRRGDRE
ncbi:hypothetical protein GALL_213780 [mine drainage metagenome]|uniref:Uncharacterized protein n=1 Tax=mine drainage metagenome TaxID=410659 RepID=A0A1J5S4J3_9ZZZZ